MSTNSLADMQGDNVNTGIYVLNAPHPQDPRTAVVLGLPRSGTTMVAGILYHLGIYMGEAITETTFEDRALSKAIEDGRNDAMRRILDERNRQYEIWGWKRPSARKHMDTIEAEFRNPHYLMVFRDPLAISVRKNMSVNSNVSESLRSNAAAQRKLVEIAGRTTAPLMLLSYEKCLIHPAPTVRAIASFLGANPTESAVSFIEPNAPAYVQHTYPR